MGRDVFPTPPNTDMSLKQGPFQKESLRSHVGWVLLQAAACYEICMSCFVEVVCYNLNPVSQFNKTNTESLQLWTNSTLHETAKSTCQGLPFPQRKAIIFSCELLVISRIGRSLSWDPDSFFTWNVILSTKDHKLSLKQGSWGEVFG